MRHKFDQLQNLWTNLLINKKLISRSVWSKKWEECHFILPFQVSILKSFLNQNKTKKDLVQDRELDPTRTNFNQCKPISSDFIKFCPS